MKIWQVKLREFELLVGESRGPGKGKGNFSSASQTVGEKFFSKLMDFRDLGILAPLAFN